MRTLVLIAVLAAGGAVATASAQVVRGELAVSGGIATDQRGIRSNAATLAPSVLVSPDPRLVASAGVSATQFAAGVRAIGGTVAMSGRQPLGPVLAVAASGAGSATTTTFAANFASADFTPTVEATLAGVTMFGGAHLARGSTTQRQATTGPGGVLGGAPTAARDVSISRASTGVIFGASMDIARDMPGQRGAVSYREEHARIQGVGVVDRLAGATLTGDALALSASLGVRDAVDEHVVHGSVAASVFVGRAVAIQGAMGTYASNRVTGALGGRFASLGVAVRAQRVLERDVAPRVRGAPRLAGGMTRLVLRAPDAGRVDIAGDWNGWALAPATRSPDGLWYVDVPLARGEYRYAFKVDGRRWRVPEGVLSVDDGWGGRSAIVAVR